MATTSHTIYSHYNPEDREFLERETGQISLSSNDSSDHPDPAQAAWNAEASATFKRRLPPAPRFVPAKIQDGEWSTQQPPQSFSGPSSTTDISSWYRSLSRSSSNAPTAPHISARPTSLPQKKPVVKDPWFIRNAVRSEHTSTSSSTSSLADMLAREPPPKPSDAKFRPPVFLHIGPSNKGFGMLERSGWNEGEALGPDILRRKRIVEDDQHQSSRKGKQRAEAGQEIIEVPLDVDGDIKEVKKIDLVDLTLDSDSDFDSECDSPPDSGVDSAPDDHLPGEEPLVRPSVNVNVDVASSSERTALVTPLRTVLKSDRLGIGLKAKTVGPYKESQKRVTHSAAAIAAHVKAAEDERRRIARFGRGKRGIAREKEHERRARQRMLAYMNE